jgi:hypothetical protein
MHMCCTIASRRLFFWAKKCCNAVWVTAQGRHFGWSSECNILRGMALKCLLGIRRMLWGDITWTLHQDVPGLAFYFGRSTRLGCSDLCGLLSWCRPPGPCHLDVRLHWLCMGFLHTQGTSQKSVHPRDAIAPEMSLGRDAVPRTSHLTKIGTAQGCHCTRDVPGPE